MANPEITSNMTTTEKVQALRLWMKAQVDGANATHTGKPVTAYLVPTADPHNDEYIPDPEMS